VRAAAVPDAGRPAEQGGEAAAAGGQQDPRALRVRSGPPVALLRRRGRGRQAAAEPVDQFEPA